MKISTVLSIIAFFLLSGLAQAINKDLIDLDKDPKILEGWTVAEHSHGGRIKWHKDRAKLYLSEKQKGESTLSGNDLQKELAGQPVMNANVLDFLMENQEQVPDEWKNKCVFFWGTIYEDRSKTRYVRSLCWISKKSARDMNFSYRPLDQHWGNMLPAAILTD